jgi:hypothetical protein
MQNKHLARIQLIIFYCAVILGLGLFIAFIYGVYTGLSTGTDIFQSQPYFVDLSDTLFVIGGAVLTFGAFIEFFVKARSPSISRAMNLPYQALANMYVYQLKDEDAARMEDTGSGGVTCIIIGAFIIIISVLFAAISMK